MTTTTTTEETIYTALFTFHGLIETISMTSTNPFFKSKYASLTDIQKAIAGPLRDSGLIIIHQLGEQDTMTTSLIHCATGSSISSTFSLHIKGDDSQAWGSAITYAKRYAIGALLNLCIDADDDGNASSGKTKTRTKSAPGKETLTIDSDKFIKARAWLQAGQGSIKRLKEKYHLTKAVENALLE